MEIIEKVESMIRSAATNFQNCPICGAPVSPDPAGADADGTIHYTHDCECLMEAAFAQTMFKEDNFFDDFPDEIRHGETAEKKPSIATWYLFGLKKGYQKWCHSCKRNGVDSELPECEPDPPYKFKCRYCKQSLKSHHLYGKGMIFDMAKFKDTWHFVNSIPKLVS